MKYYQNINSGAIIGIENMRQLMTEPTEQSINLGYKGYSYKVIYDMICPNYILGNGIDTFCINHSFLQSNFKRVNKKIALKKHPEFIQYRHRHLKADSEKMNITTFEVIQKQTF